MQIYLETERLYLRRFTSDDVDNLVDLDADPAVMRYLTGGKPTPRGQVEQVILPRILGDYDRFPGFGCWAAVEKATGAFVGWFLLRPRDAGAHPGGAGSGEAGSGEASPGDAGSGEASSDGVCAVEAELGYRLRRSSWGKGYATEGARALIRKGFTELGVSRIFAQTMAVNRASRRVMEKCGLKLERVFFPDWDDPIAGADEGEVEYALTREEWERLGAL